MTEETIFLTALEKANSADRVAYLDAVCAGDLALRERVEALLLSHDDPDSFLDEPAMVRQADGTGDEPSTTTDLCPRCSSPVWRSRLLAAGLRQCRAAGRSGALGLGQDLECADALTAGTSSRSRNIKM